MTSSNGCFFSSEDADSDGEEGTFYLWTMKEIKDALNDKDAEIAVHYFGLKEEGNILKNARPPPPKGKNFSPFLSATERHTAWSARDGPKDQGPCLLPFKL